MSYKKELDEMVWSFSRIHLWEQCPYAFYLKYIEKTVGVDNFWAENGRAMHLTLEKIFKGELSIDDAPEFYINEFDNICSTASENTMDNTFNSCLDFLCEFDFDFFNNYEILGVEKECHFEIKGCKFTGYIDLLLRRKDTNEIVVFDHKSSTYPFKKDGKTVLKNCEGNYNAYKHQMYLYSKQVIDEYRITPSKITWLHFRDQKMATIRFDEIEYNDTLRWATDTIKKIYRDKKFLPKKSFTLCNKLCEYREDDCAYNAMEDYKGKYEN